MEFFLNPRVQPILAIGAVMAAVALAITIPAMLIEARKLAVPRPNDVDARLVSRVGYLEGEMGALAVEIERLGESQRYLTRLVNAETSGSRHPQRERAANGAPDLPRAEDATAVRW
jgi:hypothetical protein